MFKKESTAADATQCRTTTAEREFDDAAQVSALEQPSSGEVALRLAVKDYHVVPLRHKSKACVDQDWTKNMLSVDQVKRRWRAHPEYGVGLKCGTEVQDSIFVYAIDVDVDDELLIERIRHAVGGDPPCKRGKKGQTFIVRGGTEFKKVIIRTTKKARATVEVLADGQHTALPPSIHPDTAEPYEWLNRPLYDVEPDQLPLIGVDTIKEIDLAVRKPDSKIFGINDMVPSSADGEGSGTRHDIMVAAIGAMVAEKFSNDYIRRRVTRAVEECDARAGKTGRDMRGIDREIEEQIRSAKAKGFDEVAKGDTPVMVMVRWLLEEWCDGGAVYNRDGQILVYTGNGWFRAYTPADFHHALAHVDHPDIPRLDINWWRKITDTLLARAPRFPSNRATRKVCLQNGSFDLDTSQLSPHSRDDFLITQLPFGYDSDARCPVFDKFAAETFKVPGEPDDGPLAQQCFEEFVAVSMFECHHYQRFLVLQGMTRSGKSVLGDVARLMHAPGSVSSVMAHDLGQEKSRASMLGKLLNVVGETSTVGTISDEYLKMIVAGEPVDVRYLYRELYSAVLPTRLLILTNEPLKTKDSSGALMERALILKCDNYVPPEKRDPQLIDKIALERSGLFNRIAAAWIRLRDRGAFVLPKSSQALNQELLVTSNLPLQHVLDCTYQGAKAIDPQYRMPKDVLKLTPSKLIYEDYKEWTKQHGHQQMSYITWGMKLSQAHGHRDLNLRPVPHRPIKDGPLVQCRRLALLPRH